MSISRFKDLTGIKQLNGRLTAIKTVGKNRLGYLWECKCDCGNIINVRSSHFIGNHTRSCGCLQPEIAYKVNLQHGHTSKGKISKEYSCYHEMIARCYNKNNSTYKYYGGRGIKVDDRWLGDLGFENFINDMGLAPSPKHSIERVKNNEGYSSSNCIWDTQKNQCRNRRTNRLIMYKGELVPMIKVSEDEGVGYFKLIKHINRGKSITEAVDRIKELENRRKA